MNDNQQDQRDPKDPGNNGGKMRQPFFIFLILSLVALFITSLIYSRVGNSSTQEITYSQFLELVNEARVAEGHEPLTWVSSDAAEEHTLQRCYELVSNYSHDRPKGKFAGEVCAKGYAAVPQAFNGWMNSPAHKAMNRTSKNGQ